MTNDEQNLATAILTFMQTMNKAEKAADQGDRDALLEALEALASASDPLVDALEPILPTLPNPLGLVLSAVIQMVGSAHLMTAIVAGMTGE